MVVLYNEVYRLSLYTNYCGIFYCIVQGAFIQAVDLDEITLRAIQTWRRGPLLKGTLFWLNVISWVLWTYTPFIRQSEVADDRRSRPSENKAMYVFRQPYFIKCTVIVFNKKIYTNWR